jgi:uncharacterized protein YjdB
MNVGESLNFSVQISGGTNATNTVAPTLASCTSSNAAVATATISGSACRVTAVTAGNVTIAAKASTGQEASAAVSISAPTPAITSLAVSPSAAQLAVGQTVTLVPTVQPAGRTATYAYATSTSTVATVSTAGVVTAVAPGVATITVTATGSATGFANATIAQAVTITVSDRTPGLTALTVQPSTVALALGGTQALTASVQGPRASAATTTYGTSAPSIATVSATGVITAVAAGTAVVTVTSQSAESGAFAASSITALVPVTVTPAAQVVINSLTRGGSTIDISNVYDQIEVNLGIQPNGQNVSEVNVWVCDPAETVAACAARTNNVPAARQSFTSAGAQASNVQLYINTSEFGTPNFVTGADASTLYKNGLRTIVATLTTSPNAASTIASNSISQVNFNNPDGWTVSWTAPSNRANDVSNITWYGGPSTPDALTPSATSGNGSYTVVPVIYTPNRTVVQAFLNMSSSCGGNITDRSRPFSITYGTAARDTLAGVLNCTNVATSTSGMAPYVAGGVDNNNNSYSAVGSSPAVARSIFDDFTNIANSTSNGYRQSLAYRPNYLYLPHDYLAPTISRFDVKGGTDATNSYVDSAWVNAAYFMVGTNPTTATGTGSFRYRISDGNVGLTSTNGAENGAGAAARNTLFSVCNNTVPTSTPTAPINCTSPVATGGIASTIGSMNVPESSNLTNSAYVAQVAETDRLGNRATSVTYSWSNSTTGASDTRTAGSFTYVGAGQFSAAAFGVDLTAPAVVTIANTGVGSVANFARTDVDSIYSALGNTYGTTNNTNAQFAVRFQDTRSGFFTCNAAVVATADNCPSFANNGTQVNAGTFNIQRRTAPSILSATNDAVNESIIRTANTNATAANRFTNVINAPVYSADNSQREFVINIFGAANRVSSTVTLTGATPAAGVDGYYTFSGTLVDRAGNTTTIPSRSVAIDNTNPSQPLVSPTVAVLQGGTTVGFTITGTDALEVISGDLSLNYPQLSVATGTGPAIGGQPSALRFRRVTNYGATSLLGFWHNPFAAVTDNKLSTPVGAGTTLGATPLNVPVPFVQHIATTVGNVPPTPTQIFALFGTATDVRPNAVQAWTYDIRATMANANIGNGQSAASPVLTIAAGQIPTPTTIATTKDWTAIQSWAVFAQAGGSVEYRAQTSSSVTNPPFQSVYIVRQVGATEWEYLGTATFAGTLDQGANRFFRYTFTSAAINQGAGVTMAAIADTDNIRAIGADASGNGLSTANSTASFAITPGTDVINLAVALTSPRLNATAPENTTLTVTPNANAATITYTCSSSDTSLIAVNCVGSTISVQNGPTPAASTSNVTITITATGTAAGKLTSSITRNIVISRQP